MTTLTQADIETKLKGLLVGMNESNITILAHYLYKYPKKWRPDEGNFAADVNKLIPEAFTHNMRPSNTLFGAIIAIFIIMAIGVMWYIGALFLNKNKKNVVDDPNVVPPAFV